MNKPAILGALILGLGACAAASCSGNENKANAGSGGQSSTTGGSTSKGGSDSGTDQCGNGDPQFYPDSGVDGGPTGLMQVGYTEPDMSITLGDGGYYSMPNSKYKGYCFTYIDAGGTKFYPPCGVPNPGEPPPPCFTMSTGLCMTAKMGIGSAVAWGGGFGCSLNQGSAAGALALYTDVVGMTSITLGVYGCAVITSQFQIQLNVVNPPTDDAGVPGDGFFCSRPKKADWVGPDANGIYTITVKLTDLTQDCWNAGGVVFDPATMFVKSIQGQVNSVDGAASSWDFCVSKLSIQ